MPPVLSEEDLKKLHIIKQTQKLDLLVELLFEKFPGLKLWQIHDIATLCGLFELIEELDPKNFNGLLGNIHSRFHMKQFNSGFYTHATIKESEHIIDVLRNAPKKIQLEFINKIRKAAGLNLIITMN